MGEIPTNHVEPPPVVVRLAERRPITTVWRNELGGLTYQIGSGTDREFVKWAPLGSELDLAAEADRLRWAITYTPVPPVRALGADTDGTWLVTSGLPGENAITSRWKADPKTAAAASGRALRALHDALPVAKCPFSWSVEVRRVPTAAAARPW